MPNFKHSLHFLCSVMYASATACISYIAGDFSRTDKAGLKDAGFLLSILFNLITATWILIVLSTIFHIIALPYCNRKVIRASAILNAIILILSILVTSIFFNEFDKILRMAYVVDLMLLFLVLTCQQAFIEALYLVIKLKAKISHELNVIEQQQKFK